MCNEAWTWIAFIGEEYYLDKQLDKKEIGKKLNFSLLDQLIVHF